MESILTWVESQLRIEMWGTRGRFLEYGWKSGFLHYAASPLRSK